MGDIAKINAVNVLLSLAEKLLTEVAANRGDEKMMHGLRQITLLYDYLDGVINAKRSRK